MAIIEWTTDWEIEKVPLRRANFIAYSPHYEGEDGSKLAYFTLDPPYEPATVHLISVKYIMLGYLPRQGIAAWAVDFRGKRIKDIPGMVAWDRHHHSFEMLLYQMGYEMMGYDD